MILYHYTCRAHLPSIMKSGLWLGEVPITRRAEDCLNAVWLTNDRDPSGHGLSDDKRAIRITVQIPSTDRRLVHWPGWGKKRLTPEWYAILDEVGIGKSRTWYLFWAYIPPAEFVEIMDLHTGYPIAPLDDRSDHGTKGFDPRNVADMVALVGGMAAADLVEANFPDGDSLMLRDEGSLKEMTTKGGGKVIRGFRVPVANLKQAHIVAAAHDLIRRHRMGRRQIETFAHMLASAQNDTDA